MGGNRQQRVLLILHQHRSSIHFLYLGIKKNAGSVVSAKIPLEVGMMVLSLPSKLTSHLLCAGQAQAAGAPAETKTQSLRLWPPGR